HNEFLIDGARTPTNAVVERFPEQQRKAGEHSGEVDDVPKVPAGDKRAEIGRHRRSDGVATPAMPSQRSQARVVGANVRRKTEKASRRRDGQAGGDDPPKPREQRASHARHVHDNSTPEPHASSRASGGSSRAWAGRRRFPCGEVAADAEVGRRLEPLIEVHASAAPSYF